ncbi:uncharacterized protein LOC5506775 isoform X2 [Nematostella vectensis]|uniref:uncharacterized protein LOC5506775 isoform X2 n=1 Tax=Nematostella vectensis TaxID=45351 RepID=UPI0020770F9A|nr:uncharacterized protein LOC5506775 isoform X2 [Nematostella vectensis]
MDDLRGMCCSVCYNPFHATESQAIPRNLNCGHTYCTGCLGKLSAQSQYAFVRCPACKHETLLLSRFNGIPSLPKNFGLLEIIESKENADKAPASASTIDQERAKHRHLCTEHDEPKKVYCYDDQVLICIYCQIYGKHQGHRCDLASRLATNVREELSKITVQIEEEHEKIVMARRAIEARKEAITQKKEALGQKIAHQASGIRTVVNKIESDLRLKLGMLTQAKLEVLEKQNRSLCQVILKCEELYTLMQRVQKDGDACLIESKSSIDSLSKEIIELSETCNLAPCAKDNLVFHSNHIETLYTLRLAVGDVMESEEVQTGACEAAHAQAEPESLLTRVLADLEQVVTDAENNNSRMRGLVESTEAQGEDTDKDSTDLTSTEEDTGEEDDEEEEMEEEGQQGKGAATAVTAEGSLSSDGDLLGAVGGASPAAAVQTQDTKRKNESKQGLLRELQMEIERLKLLGPRGELIRVVDDDESSSSEEEEEEEDTDDSSDDDDKPRLQVDFKIRVNNDTGRARASNRLALTAQGMDTSMPSESRDTPATRHRSQLVPRGSRCSVPNCQHLLNAALQCKICKRVFCRQCAAVSRICGRSQTGHSFVRYKPHNKSPKTYKSSASKSKKSTSKNLSSSVSPPWTCQRCTMINEGHVLVCAACLTSQDYDPSMVRSVCPVCTLVNEPGKSTCELCNSDLETPDNTMRSEENDAEKPD